MERKTSPLTKEEKIHLGIILGVLIVLFVAFMEFAIELLAKKAMTGVMQFLEGVPW